MDYRERAGRIISAEESRTTTPIDHARAVPFDSQAFHRRQEETVIAKLEQLRIGEMLEAANTQVWEGLGRITVTEDEPPSEHLFFTNETFPRDFHTIKAVLRARIPLITLDTVPIKRLGPVWVTTYTSPPHGDQMQTSDGHRSIGMKEVGHKIVGVKDVGSDAALRVEIAVPKELLEPTETGKLSISDNGYTEGDLTRDLWKNKYGIRDASGLSEFLGPTSTNENYRLGFSKHWPLPYLEFPYVDFDPEVLNRYIDAMILLSSISRMRNPLSEAWRKANADTARLITRVGEKILHTE